MTRGVVERRRRGVGCGHVCDRSTKATIPDGCRSTKVPLRAMTGLPAGRQRRWDLLALAASICVAALLAWPLLDRGWTPHDDGMLGQTAERIRLGQLPHRDFEDVYTGALGYWHAFAQWFFGTTMMAPRYALFGVWCGWLAIVYGIIRRVTTPWWAAAMTVTAAMWTLPIYPSAMPSWYLLFCATAVVAALLQWSETQQPRWLFAAGVMIGIGLTIKITALYLLAAALLSVAFAEREMHVTNSAIRRKWAPSVTAIVGSVVLAAMVLWLLRDRMAASELVHLAAPVVMLVLALSAREVSVLRGGGRDWNQLLMPITWMAVGMAIPVVLFALPYWVSGSLAALVHGVIIDPFSRLDVLNFDMRPFGKTVRGLYLVAFVAIELRWGATRAVRGAAIATGFWFAWRSTQSYIVYQAIWDGARFLLPATVAIIAFRFAQRSPTGRADARTRTAAITLAAFASLFALNQFPFSANVYFCFVVPLVFLALAAAVPDASSRLAGTMSLLAIFAVLSLHPGDINTLGFYPARVDLGHRLGMARGGLRVSADDSAKYATVQALVEAHRDGLPIYAGPGIPEIPFLAGPPYYGHYVFHFFPFARRDTTSADGTMSADSAAVLIWNLHPAFGEPVSPSVKAWYDARFPHAARIGERFEVRWRTVQDIATQP